MSETTTWRCDFKGCKKRTTTKAKGWLLVTFVRYGKERVYHLCSKHADDFIDHLMDPEEPVIRYEDR
jgi:hypothetical protein